MHHETEMANFKVAKGHFLYPYIDIDKLASFSGALGPLSQWQVAPAPQPCRLESFGVPAPAPAPGLLLLLLLLFMTARNGTLCIFITYGTPRGITVPQVTGIALAWAKKYQHRPSAPWGRCCRQYSS